MKNRIVNMIFPNVCPICDQVLGQTEKICEKCRTSVHVINEPRCMKCGKQLNTEERLYCNDCKKISHIFQNGISVFDYKGEIKDSLYRFKYNNMRCYAEYYGDEAFKMYGRQIKSWKIDLIIPIPMYHKKQQKRGYNQAVEFAKVISKYTSIPLDEKCLIRVKNTVPQKGLNNEQRYQNLDKAFAVDKDRVEKCHRVLLIDDIYTTGSTIDNCAKVLKKAGVVKIYFLCVAAGRDKN